MTEWSVEVDLEVEVGEGEEAEDRIDALLEILEPRSPAVSYQARWLSARFIVDERRAKDAAWRGLEVINVALKKAGFNPPGDALRFEAESLEALANRVDESNAHELIGVSELAELLTVSRQRASELARSADFPAPVARLQSGPVWRKTAVARYVGHWERKPGRPPRELTERERQVLELIREEKRTPAEAAAILGVSSATVRRMLKQLVEAMERTREG